MKNSTLAALWGVLFTVCLVLGFLPQLPTALGLLAGIAFFVPGFFLAVRQPKATAILSGASLLLTTAAIAGNFAGALASQTAGDMLHVVLGVVSVPMFCTQVWVVSLFLWGCLLVFSLMHLGKKENSSQ